MADMPPIKAQGTSSTYLELDVLGKFLTFIDEDGLKIILHHSSTHTLLLRTAAAR